MSSYKRLPSSSKCSQCPVGKYSICGSAEGQLQQDLNAISHDRHYSAGETILYEGEKGGIVGNVISGVVRVLRTLADGRQQIVGLLLPSDMFGRVFASTEQFSVEAATDVTLCCFERRAFERLMEANQTLEHKVLLSVLDELDAARDWLILLGCQNAAEKVASFLIFLHLRSAHHLKNGRFAMPAINISVPISRRDMAAYLGTTVETISRTIRLMARKKIIEINDPQHFTILNWDRLVGMSGREEYVSQIVLPDLETLDAHSEPGTKVEVHPRKKAHLHQRDSAAEILLKTPGAITRPVARKISAPAAKSTLPDA